MVFKTQPYQFKKKKATALVYDYHDKIKNGNEIRGVNFLVANKQQQTIYNARYALNVGYKQRNYFIISDVKSNVNLEILIKIKKKRDQN